MLWIFHMTSEGELFSSLKFSLNRKMSVRKGEKEETNELK